MCVCARVCPSREKSQRKVSDALELNLQVTVTALVCVLETGVLWQSSRYYPVLSHLSSPVFRNQSGHVIFGCIQRLASVCPQQALHSL